MVTQLINARARIWTGVAGCRKWRSRLGPWPWEVEGLDLGAWMSGRGEGGNRVPQSHSCWGLVMWSALPSPILTSTFCPPKASAHQCSQAWLLSAGSWNQGRVSPEDFVVVWYPGSGVRLLDLHLCFLLFSSLLFRTWLVDQQYQLVTNSESQASPRLSSSESASYQLILIVFMFKRHCSSCITWSKLCNPSQSPVSSSENRGVNNTFFKGWFGRILSVVQKHRTNIKKCHLLLLLYSSYDKDQFFVCQFTAYKVQIHYLSWSS